MTAGPYETEQEIRETAAVRDAYRSAHTSLGIPGANRRILSGALSAAGVNLGTYDTRILVWLTGWEPQTCAVIASWITRASQERKSLAMTGKSQRKHAPGPDTADAAAASLRETIREAHAAIRDLSGLIREARQILSASAQEHVDRAMQAKVNAEIARLQDHIQSESERVTRQVESEMVKAREWMMRNLELISITETPSGLRAEFNRPDRE